MAIAALTGCHNRAYNDLYVESMAAEIRDLEDQLYEYDHEYRELEQELASLRAENRLKESQPKKAPEPTSPLNDRGQAGADFSSRSPFGLGKPNQLPAEPTQPRSVPQRSIIEPEAAAPSAIASPPVQPSPSEDTLPAPTRTTPGEAPAGDEFNLDSLLPPTIEPGEPMPPPALEPGGKNAALPRGKPENNLEMNLTRIEIPAQLASQSSNLGQGKLTLATEQVTDTRVVELAFHPAHSRAANFDEDAADDGLVLLLQPRNERGQMVPLPAALSVVVLDPAREGNAARIGRWDYSADEVKNKLQPMGANQGIQLTLPWNGPDPSADRVIVFARYTFDNGRQVIGQKEIYVTSNDGFKTVWAPRGTSAASTEVVPASADQLRWPTNQGNVVRPASGTSPLDPAPLPTAASTGRY